jgi:glycosyltransferase involved in cell wall biosynthesis
VNRRSKRIGILASHPIQYHAPLFRELARRPGIDVTVYFCSRLTETEQGVGFGVPFAWDIDLTSGYRHIWLKNRPRPFLKSAFWNYNTPNLSEIIRCEHFDAFLVHGWNSLSCWQAFLACWSTRTPLLVRSDSQLPAQPSSLKRVVKRLLYPLFIRHFDVCLPYGKRSEEYFTYYGAKKIVVAPHAVDNSWFCSRAQEARADLPRLRARWGIDERSYVFLFVGKFEPKKRPLDALKALAQCTRTDNGVALFLLMVGEGALRKECEDFAHSHNLPVRFTGFLNQSEMPQAYALADCLLLCSDGRETWGLVVNEAMACGLPAIVSDAVGCVPDLIIQDITGFSYPYGDISTLAKCMQYVAGNPTHSQCLSLSALDHIEKYATNKAADEIIQSVNNKHLQHK